MSKNVTTTVDGNILTITINLAKKGEETKNGKNYRVAYTEGWGGFEKLDEVLEGYTLSTVLLRNKDVPVPGAKKEKAAKSKTNKKTADTDDDNSDGEEAPAVTPKKTTKKASTKGSLKKAA